MYCLQYFLFIRPSYNTNLLKISTYVRCFSESKNQKHRHISLSHSIKQKYFIILKDDKTAKVQYSWTDGWPLEYTNWDAGQPSGQVLQGLNGCTKINRLVELFCYDIWMYMFKYALFVSTWTNKHVKILQFSSNLIYTDCLN